MAKILGKNVTLLIVTGESPEVVEMIGCSRTCELTTTVDILPASTLGSGLWKEFKAISNSWSGRVDGLTTVNENLTIATLRTMQALLQPVVISFEEVVGALVIDYRGAAIIVSVQTSGNYADAETYNVQLQGTGELTIT